MLADSRTAVEIMKTVRQDLRNVAIIAHVDHGKTTLVDGLLRQARVFRANQAVVERVMDSNALERERGITILAKNTAVSYGGVRINIVDTPGHADFGGEVERVMNMVDGVLLLVDAAEGPMPQTRFVLRQALAVGHRVIVVINKVDRKNADPVHAVNRTFDLFIELGARDDQAEFPIVYTNALTGRAGFTPDLSADLQPLFDTILDHIPAPSVDVDAPLQMLVTTLTHDAYQGPVAIGRIFAGRLEAGQAIARIGLDGQITPARARAVYIHQGLQRVEVERAQAGEIVALAGLEEVRVGETIADLEQPQALPQIRVEAPTVRMTFGVSTSPLAGRDGPATTSRRLRDRLWAEATHDVALQVETTDSAEVFLVSGRGELHLAILIETMRREGYEFQVSRPEVILKPDGSGSWLEPVEEVHLEVPEGHVGTVVELLGRRRGQMVNIHPPSNGSVAMSYHVPTRGLLGFRYHFLTATQGTGILHSLFHAYEPFAGAMPIRDFGSLVAWEDGLATAFGLKNAEERGVLFIAPGAELYQGMVVGQHQRPGDLNVNVAKRKHLTNVRSSTQDIAVRLTPARRMSLDECLEYLAEDELLEVTPQNLRLRKRILGAHERGRLAKVGA